MSILNGIKLKGDSTVHQLDYENGVANKPKIIKSYNDLEDKPFEDLGDVKITFDGDLSKKEHIIAMEEEGVGRIALVKLSDETPKKENLIGGNIVISSFVEGVAEPYYNGVITDEMILSPTSQLHIIADFIFVAEENTEADGIMVTKGIWTTYQDFGGQALTVTELSYSNLKQIDGKYVRNMYYSSYVDETVIPSEEYEFQREIGHSDYYHSFGNDTYVLNEDIDIAYRVTFDGVEYLCSPFMMDDGEVKAVYVGNLSVSIENEYDSGEPFLVVCVFVDDRVLDFQVHTKNSGTTHTFGLEIVDKETIVQVPSKYVDAYTKEETANLIASAIITALNTEV